MVYVISDGSGWVKVGKADDVNQRLKELQIGNPRELTVLYEIRVAWMSSLDAEKKIHKYLSFASAENGANVTTEWFRRDAFEVLLRDDCKRLCEILQVNRGDLVIDRPVRKTDTQWKQLYLKSNDKCKAYEKEIQGLKTKLRELRNELAKKKEYHVLPKEYVKCEAEASWIPASDVHPPAEDGLYLATAKKIATGDTTIRVIGYGKVRGFGRPGKIWDWRRNPNDTEIIAWMHLPKPYLEEL